jgi:curved DNA-binding protein CbpA
MKNYYRILQVDPEAELDVIEAAYKRLMLKYHPDKLSPEQRVNKSLLEKVQEINEAYDILSDDAKRKEYDKSVRPGGTAAQINNKLLQTSMYPLPIDKRILLVKCAVSKRTYRMLLARKKGRNVTFRIMGFEPVASEINENEQEKAGGKQGKVVYKPRENAKFKSDEEITELFYKGDSISIGDIDWSEPNNCPDCGAEFDNSSNIVRWLHCNSCLRLYCVGNIKKGILGTYTTTCPWCGRTGRLNAKGSKARDSSIGGVVHSKPNAEEIKLIPEKSQKALKDGCK